MINRQLSRLLLCSILGSTTLISGCALVRKDSAPHQQLKPEQIKLADDIHLASSGWPQAQWWKQLNDPQLDALIQRTLSGSHTLAEAKLREEKAQAEVQLKDLNAEIERTDLALSDRMAESETQNFTRAGIMFCLTTKTRASAAAGRKEELFSALRVAGYGDLIYETVNANSLSAFVKEQICENADKYMR